MKIRQRLLPLIALSLGLLGGLVACAEDKEVSCTSPSPFKLLDKADADKYPLSAILDKSTSPYAILTEDKVNNNLQVVNFWATWCAPCRQELPLLDKIHVDKIAKVNLINVGDEKKIAEDILAELKIIHLKTRLADSDILSTFAIMGLPASLVYADNDVYLGMGKLKDEKAITDWLSCLAE